jgi:hypothetical protein
VSSKWWETSPQTHIGSTHEVEERIGGDEILRPWIAFHDPTETFSAESYKAALASGHVSIAVCARIGMGGDPPRDEVGRPRGGRMTHVARDTPYGCVVRSDFWLGQGLGAPAEELGALLRDEIGLGLM